MPRLKANELCPLLRSTKCSGRTVVNTRLSKRQSRNCMMVAPGVRRYPDGREVCSPAALKKRKDALIRQGEPCVFCDQPFADYREVDLCHRESKGSGGWRRDDSLSNVTLGHRVSNMECGSRSIEEYMREIRAAGKKFPCEAR